MWKVSRVVHSLFKDTHMRKIVFAAAIAGAALSLSACGTKEAASSAESVASEATSVADSAVSEAASATSEAASEAASK
jgi:hypothetical protein